MKLLGSFQLRLIRRGELFGGIKQVQQHVVVFSVRFVKGGDVMLLLDVLQLLGQYLSQAYGGFQGLHYAINGVKAPLAHFLLEVGGLGEVHVQILKLDV